MVRYEIGNGVAYGLDHVTGYFLSISNEELMKKVKIDEAEKALVTKDRGDGSFFELQTGPPGRGMGDSMETVAKYWKRFGVPQEHIDQLLRGTMQD